jgi:serine/threonine-protein kinase
MAATFEDRLRAVLPSHVSIATSLATGGQGTVFRGECRGSPAAVKVFSAATDLRRVDRECDLLSKLSCPHVVRLIEHFDVKVDADSLRIVVYEFHPGGDLSRLHASGSAAVSEALLLKIGQEIGTGIATLWMSRIVHRDIKPANIVKAADGRFLLVDVGLARHLDLSDLTAAGGAPGTRGFRSPEQSLGRKSLTINSDVYSLGMTLYVLAAKRHPFGGIDITSPASIDVAPMTAARPLSKGLVALIKQMLEFSPARRPSDIVARFSALGVP